MVDPLIVDDLIADHTAHELRITLMYYELTATERAHIIAAIYYMEGNDND